MLKAPGGAIVNVADAIKQIEDQERGKMTEEGYDLFTVKGVYYSEAAEGTGHVCMGQHDDTGVFAFFMDDPMNTEEKDGVTRYTFSDGVVLVQHNGVLDTESEYKDKLQPQK